MISNLPLVRNQILILLLVLGFTSCKKTSNYAFTKDIKIEIMLADNEGEDLFNPESYFYYNPNSIKIFHLLHGEMIEIKNQLLDPPQNFYLNYVNGRHRMQLFPNHDKSEQFPITLIQWNSSKMDTVKCDFDRNVNSIICNKVWYNDELVWEANNNNGTRLFEIIISEP